jgi:hypothetical protein
MDWFLYPEWPKLSVHRMNVNVQRLNATLLDGKSNPRILPGRPPPAKAGCRIKFLDFLAENAAARLSQTHPPRPLLRPPGHAKASRFAVAAKAGLGVKLLPFFWEW